MRVQFCKLNPSVRMSNRDSEPLGSSYKLEPTEKTSQPEGCGHLPKWEFRNLGLRLAIFLALQQRIVYSGVKSSCEESFFSKSPFWDVRETRKELKTASLRVFFMKSWGTLPGVY